MVDHRQGTTFGPGPIAVSTTSDSISSTASIVGPSLPLSIHTTSTASGTTSMALSSGSPTLTIPDSSSSDSGSASDTPSVTISSTSPIPTPTQTQGTPGFSPSWAFLTPTNATTCQPYQIQWAVSDSASTDLSGTHLHLFVTNIDHNMTLVTNQSITDDEYTWPVVNVPQGNYSLHGIETDGSFRAEQLATFSVQNGTDTSCLSSTGSDGSQNGTVISAAKSGSGTNTAAIAGGTVGGFVLLVCAGVAAFFLCAIRRRPKSKRSHELRKDWNGLSSIDSKAPLSRGSLQGDGIDHFGPQGASVIRAIGRAHVDSSSSLEAEKAPNDPTGRGHTLPVLTRQGSWSTINAFETDSTGHGLPRALELAHLPSRHSAPGSPRSSSDFNDPFAAAPNTNNRRASRTQRKPVPAYEPTPEELEAMAIERTRSGGSQSRSSMNQHPPLTFNPTSYSHQPSSSLSTVASLHGEALLNGLKSKSSGHFDDQPVHYLIPDMPPAPPED